MIAANKKHVTIFPHTKNTTNKRHLFFKESGRFLIYTVLVFLIAELMMWNASIDESEIKFSEFSPVEYLQSFLLLLCSVTSIGFFLTQGTKKFRYIFLLIFGLTTAALIREQDIYFEQWFGHGTWPYLVLIVLGFVGYMVYNKKMQVWAEIVSYLSTKSYAFMTFGVITVFVFSRLYGRTIFWESVMEEKYFRTVKNVSEECIELYGYLFIVFAVVELIIFVLNARKYPDES